MVSRFKVFEVQGFRFKVSGSGFRGSWFLQLGLSGSYFRCLGFTVRGFAFGVRCVRGSGFSRFRFFGVSQFAVFEIQGFEVRGF